MKIDEQQWCANAEANDQKQPTETRTGGGVVHPLSDYHITAIRRGQFSGK